MPPCTNPRKRSPEIPTTPSPRFRAAAPSASVKSVLQLPSAASVELEEGVKSEKWGGGGGEESYKGSVEMKKAMEKKEKRDKRTCFNSKLPFPLSNERPPH